MRVFFIAIGVIGVTFVLFIATPSYRLEEPPISVEAAAGAPLSQRAEELLARTKSDALVLVAQTRRWERVSIYLGFSGLMLTALATLYAGWKSQESRAGKEEFLNKKITGIGALTALATLAAAGGDLVDRVGVRPLATDVAALKKAMVDIPTALAVEPEAETSILDALEVTLAEHGP